MGWDTIVPKTMNAAKSYLLLLALFMLISILSALTISETNKEY